MADGSDGAAQNAIAPNSVIAELVDRELWLQFHEHGTEMIVTKEGRKLFPKLEYRISGMASHTSYALCIFFQRVDKLRYKYKDDRWFQAGAGEPLTAPKYIYHYDQPVRIGQRWMSGAVSFEKVKITNAPDESICFAQLHSMHKYIPTLLIFQVEPSGTNTLVSVVQDECTEFIAVTAYQNPRITHLKVEKNPFAKGFRDKSDQRRGESTQRSDTALMTATSLGSNSSINALSLSTPWPVLCFDLNNMRPQFQSRSAALLSTTRTQNNYESALSQLPQLHGRAYPAGAEYNMSLMSHLFYPLAIYTPNSLLPQNRSNILPNRMINKRKMEEPTNFSQ